MVFLDILSTKESLLRPEVSVCGMLVALDQQQSRWRNTFSLDKLTGSSDGLVLTALNAILGHQL